jgi:hypothetical protein
MRRGLTVRMAVAGTLPVVVVGTTFTFLLLAMAQLRESGQLSRQARDELVATAVGTPRAELAASRARIVAAADETRRRIERDLHDGTQQRLVSLGLELRLAQSGVRPPSPRSRRKSVGSRTSSTMPWRSTRDRARHPPGNSVRRRAGAGPAHARPPGSASATGRRPWAGRSRSAALPATGR